MDQGTEREPALRQPQPARPHGAGRRRGDLRRSPPARRAARRMALAPPLRRVRVETTHRLIPSRYPATGILDTIAAPGDLAAIIELEGWTNDRLQAELGLLPLIPESEWVVGPSATVIMAAFFHPAHDGSRFTDHRLGAWYAA